MSTADLDILSPDGTILKDPGQVERALAEMWKDAGKAVTEDAPQAAATRVCVANLVVVAAETQWDSLLEVLGELSPMYPTRTIALLMSEDSLAPAASQSHRQEDAPAAEFVRASVSALCHVPQAGQPQVCCEQILLWATNAQTGDLHRTVLAMLEADVPVMVWWTLEPGACNEFMLSAARVSRRLIIDAGLPGVTLLDSLPYPQVRELGWYRIHRWREIVAGLFDECGAEPLRRVDEVRVEIGDMAADGSAAVWLIAFLGGQLGWKLRNGTAGDGEAGSVRFEFAGPSQSVIRVSIVRGKGEGLIGLSIRCGANTFEARRDREELRIMVHEEHVCQVPRVVHLPRLKRSEALATALAGRAVDPAFARAAPLAAWMSTQLVRQVSDS